MSKQYVLAAAILVGGCSGNTDQMTLICAGTWTSNITSDLSGNDHSSEQRSYTYVVNPNKNEIWNYLSEDQVLENVCETFLNCKVLISEATITWEAQRDQTDKDGSGWITEDYGNIDRLSGTGRVRSTTKHFREGGVRWQEHTQNADFKSCRSDDAPLKLKEPKF